MEKALKLFHRDMVEMNRMPSNMTNHISVLVTGMGLAAIALYGDDPENPALEPYISGVKIPSRISTSNPSNNQMNSVIKSEMFFHVYFVEFTNST